MARKATSRGYDPPETADAPRPTGQDDPLRWAVGKWCGLLAVQDHLGRTVCPVYGQRDIGAPGVARRAALLASAGRLRERLAALVRLAAMVPDLPADLIEALGEAERVLTESRGA